MRPCVPGALLLTAFLAQTLSGCGGCDTSGQDPIEFRGGNINASRTVYETGAFDDDLLHFPPGRVYDLVHGLLREPHTIHTYVSFDRRLQGDANLADSAGNQVVIESATNELIRVRNDTCAEFYLRVAAEADEEALTPLSTSLTIHGTVDPRSQ